MAATFENHLKDDIGTSTHYMFDDGAYSNGMTGLDSGKNVIVTGILVTNVKSPAQSVTVTVHITTDGSTNYALVKDLNIPAGDSVELCQGKIVMQSGQDIGVTASTTAAVDCVVSILKNA